MKIMCKRKVQSKSENPKRSAAVRKFHAYERSEVPNIRKFSAYKIFWIYSTPFFLASFVGKVNTIFDFAQYTKNETFFVYIAPAMEEHIFI